MTKLLMAVGLVGLMACSDKKDAGDELNLMPRFDTTWNIYKSYEKQEDGSIVYNSLPWGGLVASVKENNDGKRRENSIVRSEETTFKIGKRRKKK